MPFARGEIVDRNERYKSVRVVKGGLQYCEFTITIVFMDFNPERSTTIVEYQRHQKKTQKRTITLVNIRKTPVTMQNIGVEEPKPYRNPGQHIP